PQSAVIRFLSSKRDRLPDGRPLFELLLTYEFDQASAGSLTPRFPPIDGMLYDSPFGSHLWMLFDSKQRRVRTDDIWPSAVKLQKGRYTLILQLRHSDLSRLQKTRSLLLALDRPLSKAISLSFYASRVAAVERKTKFAPRPLHRGEKAVMTLAAPRLSQLPKLAVDGDMLLGTVYYGRSKSVSGGSGQRPGGYPIRYAVTGTGRFRTGKQGTNTSPPRGGSLAHRLKELKFAELESLAVLGKPSAAFERLASGLLQESPGGLRVLTARLKLLDHAKYRKERLPAIVEAADAILKRIDQKALALEFGQRVNSADSAAVRQRKKMEAEKAALIDTLYRKGRALGYMELPDVLAKHPIADPKRHDRAFESTFAALRRWVKITDRKYVLLHVRRERRKGRYGKALKLLGNYKSDSASNYWYHRKRRDIFRKLGWHHLAELEVLQLAIRYPKRLAPF
ncbi:MAG: tripeptidyl peptidase II, partial [Planctomycetes bacterium]|nr:tripeptidyl peptidase II [Planctomycetota bacterium]